MVHAPHQIKYELERPFKDELTSALIEDLGEALCTENRRLDLANLMFSELCNRRKRARAQAELLFSENNLSPIAWYGAAREAALKSLRKSKNHGLRGNVYVVLRGGYRVGGDYGLYVGSTRKIPEERFREHKAGVRSARGLQKYGLELMYSLFAWGNPTKGKKEDLLLTETNLHRALAKVVPRVTGDTLKG